MKPAAALRRATPLVFALALLAGTFCVAGPALADSAVSSVELVSVPTVESFTDQMVTSATGPPVLSTSSPVAVDETNGNWLTLTFDKDLKAMTAAQLVQLCNAVR